MPPRASALAFAFTVASAASCVLLVAAGVVATSDGDARADAALPSPPPTTATPLDGAAPPFIDLELPGDPKSVNPSPEEHALALLRADEWNRALPCPNALAPTQPSDGNRHRCRYQPTSTLRLGRATLWVGLARYTSEHDGMYTIDDELVLLRPTAAGPHVVATIVEWHQQVVDCFTHLKQRRARVADLDRDGEPDLCIESVEERGAGLFEVMDLGARPWTPTFRRRAITAWRLDGKSGKLVAAPTLAARCPRTGYRPFVGRELTDPIGARRRVQGDAPVRKPTRWTGCGDHEARFEEPW